MNSPHQCQKKFMEKSKEKMDTDVMVWSVKVYIISSSSPYSSYSVS